MTQQQKLTRRRAIQVVIGTLALAIGRRAKAQNPEGPIPDQVTKRSEVRLVLDSIASVDIVYKGQVRRITPQEVIDALGDGK